MTDEIYMQRCIDIAKRGIRAVAPNPMVGCVLVVEGKIIGEGYHERYGEAHAEVNAINNVSNQNLLKNATLYVSLEPCSHTGKTPPCCDLLIQKGIKKVIVGTKDPNPLVGGKGIEKLKNSGIEVSEGILKDQF